MNIFAVERRDERAVDPVDHIVREIVGLVLEGLDARYIVLEGRRVLEDFVKQGCRTGKPLRDGRKHIVELRVTWNELHLSSPLVGISLRYSRASRNLARHCAGSHRPAHSPS